jgi:hypothetical protein
MPLKLNSSGGGSVTLDTPSTASTYTLTVPAITGTAVVTGSSATVTPTMLSQPLTSATAQTASGSSIDFTGIPDWVTRITISLRVVSFAALGAARVRLGTSGGLVTTGYTTLSSSIATTPAITMSALTDGIVAFNGNDGTATITGTIILTKLGGATNWVGTGNFARNNDNLMAFSNGQLALGATLTSVSVVATTSTFDAGQIGLMYE